MPKTARTALAAAALIAGGALAAPVGAQAATLLGLTADNRLIRIDSETRRAEAPMRVTGADGRLLGIDQRPQDGGLYGVTESGQIVRIDPMSGRATQVSRLNMPFESGGRAVVDFNPVANRLRLMGMSGVNFRVNVETGEVVRDGTQKYMDGSPQAGTTPRITAGAYTNSVAPPAGAPAAGQPGAPSTALYTIDTLLGTYNLQAPPNDGVQQVKGMLGMSVPVALGFDVLSDGQGGNTGFVLAGGTLHGIDLATGRLMAQGAVAGLPEAEVIDIAAMR
ncbi:DUF4394 domain-containing protein [Falsiroseomonas tokyonensis]|uniref:DUF4394 domain-containing protein n=1 Tax=Falsiroseomonas tokyonensis TaxID=430521 RepID=A0ABV7BMH9_9PROT|nr:DUF4394 domain-containing protein [Falsiroseomonas tokyonensis]MBU8536780.1 DUF4394 domain-containing protein [Falsiroseomonas tokyonensis]